MSLVTRIRADPQENWLARWAAVHKLSADTLANQEESKTGVRNLLVRHGRNFLPSLATRPHFKISKFLTGGMS